MRPHVLARRVPLVAITFLASCGGRARIEDVPGTYAFRKGAAVDTLMLGARGDYIHLYVSPGRAAVRDTGSWKAEATARGVRLTMSNFSMHFREATDPQLPAVSGFWVVDLRRTLGSRLRLPVDEDIGLYYVKR
jgi:hypothetical protein